MADFIIKSAAGTGNKTLIQGQDQSGSNYAIQIGDAGASTLHNATLTNATIATLRHAHFGFKAYVSGTVDIPNVTHTEASATGTWTEEWDSDGKLASGRFTPTVQGIYLCGYTVDWDHLDNDERTIASIGKNGVDATGTDFGARIDQKVGGSGGNVDFTLSASTLMKLDTDDYISLWVYHAEGATIAMGQHVTQWWASFMGTI